MLFTNSTVTHVRTIVHSDNRRYLIAPVVAIVAGILNEELVPVEEISHFVPAWNGIPVMLGHPTLHGEYISANSPDLVTQCLGRLWNATMSNDKLQAEIWLDIELCNKLGGDALKVLHLLESNEPIEVSVAYFRDLECQQGRLNGKRYIGIARNLRPDHIALLLNEDGACSWGMGCGVPRVNSLSTTTGLRKVIMDYDNHKAHIYSAWCSRFLDDNSLLPMKLASLQEVRADSIVIRLDNQLLSYPYRILEGGKIEFSDPIQVVAVYQPLAENVRSIARVPDYDGIESISWASVPKTFTAYRDGYYKFASTKPDEVPASVQEAPAGMRRWIASKSLLGDAQATSWDDLLFFPVVNPETNKLNEGALRAVLSGRGAMADISEEALESARSVARQLLDKEFKSSQNKIMATLQMLAALVGLDIGRSQKDQEETMDRKLELVNQLNGRCPISYEGLMALSEDDLVNIIQAMQARCELNTNKTQEPNMTLVLPQEVTALSDFVKEIGGIDVIRKAVNSVLQANEQKRDALISSLIANSQCTFTKEELASMTDAQLSRLADALLVSVDYHGRGIPGKGIEELPMPSPFTK